jgi:hypothetical protein
MRLLWGTDPHTRVLDNSSRHKTPSIQRSLVRHPRFSFHFTPTYSPGSGHKCPESVIRWQ